MAEQNATTQSAQPIIINVPPTTATPSAPLEPVEAKRAKREARIAEAKSEGANEVLKSLGVKKRERARILEEVKAGRMKLAEAKEVASTANQVAVQATTAVSDASKATDAAKAEAETLRTTLKKYADAEFAALPESFQKAIVEMKLDDPQKRLDAIDVFKRTGVLAAGVSAAAAASSTTTETKVETKTETKKPSTTLATPPDQRSPAGASLNYYETWKAMSDRGETWLAAQYLHANQVKILAQRPTK